MDKRVVIFLILSVVLILGYDVVLKKMGWLPESPPAQDGCPGLLFRGARVGSRARDRQGQRFDRSGRPNPIGAKVWRSLIGYFAINIGTDGDG